MMQKSTATGLATLAALCACLSATAQELAPDLALRKAECPKVARAAGYAYYAKREEGKVLALSDAYRATGLAPIYQWSIDYATDTASGPDDAVHKAIEKCLRNVETVKAATARGENFPIENLK